MPKVSVFNVSGSQVEELELNDAVFGITPNVHVLNQAVLLQRASLRRGTHKVKGRSEVRGGGRKPWKQKGTGRARQGSIRSPQWKGGGTVFGPHPRSYEQKMPKKMRHLALRSALAAKAKENQIKVIDEFKIADGAKTREMR